MITNLSTTDNPKTDPIRSSLMAWGQEHVRSFPWRYSNDPYKILISEFMLHRTQTQQVFPIFEKFLLVYPSLSSLVKSDPDEIRQLLNPLGLDWRIDGMISALFTLWSTYGEIPMDYDKLVSIRGIGQYIAGATLCFSTDRPFTLIDTNMVRVIGRVLGLDLTGEARRRQSVIRAIASTVPPDHPRDFYYTLIDLAQLICHPRNPDCQNCPLSEIPCEYKLTLK
jgi:A/G-specific adenine glycosylase